MISVCVALTVSMVTLGDVATRGAEPLLQVKVRKEPLAVQVRTSVLLTSMTSARLELMATSDTGSGGGGRSGHHTHRSEQMVHLPFTR